RHGRIDVLVNNVSFGRGDDILSIDEATWDAVLAGTLKSVYLCSRAVLPSMLAAGRGTIVNIGSVNGLAAFGHHAYSAAKAGVISLTQNMAVEYGRRGIRANCICPGTVQTAAWTGRLERQPDLFDRIVPWYPARRLGLPEDVAAAAAFLASDEAGFINGATLVVDGGLTAGVEGLARTIRSEPERVAE
ncbi:MAG: SDR family oxidoreductase, partial [Candidatus Limnocylindria bacterium]